ncbi:hypothetical protein V500_00460 [Pseudogymnoascus sp. VKM F-4518 (FW-2643)]|nr:hypothetical protein V500_00460 [Pseudogymnoascus sp. VKM F-4518 (FW-2643)]
MASTQLQNVSIYVKLVKDRKAKYERIDTSTIEYRVMKNIIDKALILLEHGEGMRSLSQLAEAIVRERWRLQQNCLYPRHDTNFEQIDGRVGHFLRHMRERFPPVVLQAVDGEAGTIRKTWSSANSTLDDYETQDAGELHIHHGLLNSMVRTQNQGDREIFNFQMVLSVAHEITHFLTVFLSGTDRPLTPPAIAVPGLGGLTGEAGRYWEEKFLGGIVEFYAHPRDPHNPDQAGVPYIFESYGGDSVGKLVSSSYIKAFFDGRPKLPTVSSKSSPDITRSSLRAISKEMSILRLNRVPTTLPALVPSDAAGNI